MPAADRDPESLSTVRAGIPIRQGVLLRPARPAPTKPRRRTARGLAIATAVVVSACCVVAVLALAARTRALSRPTIAAKRSPETASPVNVPETLGYGALDRAEDTPRSPVEAPLQGRSGEISIAPMVPAPMQPPTPKEEVAAAESPKVGSEAKVGIEAPPALSAAPAVLDKEAEKGVADAEPDNRGPLKLVSASWLGGATNERIDSVAITPDRTVVLMLNGVDLRLPPGVKVTSLGPPGALQDLTVPAPPPAPTDPNDKDAKRAYDAALDKIRNWVHPSRRGIVVLLSDDGSKVVGCAALGYGLGEFKRTQVSPDGNLWVQVKPPKVPLKKGESPPPDYLLNLGKDAAKILQEIRLPGLQDFAFDSNGDIVALYWRDKPNSGPVLGRFSPDGKTEKWTATWKAYGYNVPGGMAVCPKTGVATVVGYGMTHTGKQPYKDPFAYGFDRDGKQVWQLWNPEPSLQASPGGNGLCADGTGLGAFSSDQGGLYLVLKSDGGNNVLTRDPGDPAKQLDPDVFKDVHQNGPGWGFKGAGMTSVVFRVDPVSGRLEKGTWMTAWRGGARSLLIRGATSDAQGRVYVTGGSDLECPVEKPWFSVGAGEHRGGGFLAVFDRNFKKLQIGTFPGVSGFETLAARDGLVVVAGRASEFEDSDKKYPTRLYKPLQRVFGGGDKDGYYAIFRGN